MMNLVDSDLLIGVLRGHQDAHDRWAELLGQEEIICSALSAFELHRTKGPLSERRRAQVQMILDNLIVVPVVRSIAERAGDLGAMLDRQGRAMDPIDLHIASSALELGIPVHTRNVKHFERIPGLEVIPW